MYRVGFPGWKLAARVGMPVFFRVEVMHDEEAKVYVATSPDLRGLVAEAETVDEMFHAVYDCVNMLMDEQIKQPLKSKPLAAWSGELLAA